MKNVSYLKDRRKELRNNHTPAEEFLWQYLKSSRLKGRKFRRQESIDNYIVDFYCPAEKLIVELDGDVHSDPAQAKYDRERDQLLRDLGNKVLRFENDRVFGDVRGVLAVIEGSFDQPQPE